MERDEGNPQVRVFAPQRFEDLEVATLEWRGRPAWSARQVAAALGYADEADVVRRVRQDWSDEAGEGTDYEVVRGDELAAVKAAAPDLVDPRAPALMLLTESGVHLVCLLSRQPKSKALRRWLADVALPAWHRGQAVAPPAARPTLSLSAFRAGLPAELLLAPAHVVLELYEAEAGAGRPLPLLRSALTAPPPGESEAPTSTRDARRLMEQTRKQVYDAAREVLHRTNELLEDVRARRPDFFHLRSLRVLRELLEYKFADVDEALELANVLDELERVGNRIRMREASAQAGYRNHRDGIDLLERASRLIDDVFPRGAL